MTTYIECRYVPKIKAEEIFLNYLTKQYMAQYLFGDHYTVDIPFGQWIKISSSIIPFLKGLTFNDNPQIADDARQLINLIEDGNKEGAIVQIQFVHE